MVDAISDVQNGIDSMCRRRLVVRQAMRRSRPPAAFAGTRSVEPGIAVPVRVTGARSSVHWGSNEGGLRK